MKGKLITDVTTSDNEMIVIGTEVEIVDIRYGCEVYYMCIIPSGRQIMINANDIEITGYDRCIDWEQRRYEISKDVLSSFLSNSNEMIFEGNPEDHAKDAVLFADALIRRLKGGNK